MGLNYELAIQKQPVLIRGSGYGVIPCMSTHGLPDM